MAKLIANKLSFFRFGLQFLFQGAHDGTRTVLATSTDITAIQNGKDTIMSRCGGTWLTPSPRLRCSEDTGLLSPGAPLCAQRIWLPAARVLGGRGPLDSEVPAHRDTVCACVCVCDLMMLRGFPTLDRRVRDILVKNPVVVTLHATMKKKTLLWCEWSVTHAQQI